MFMMTVSIPVNIQTLLYEHSSSWQAHDFSDGVLTLSCIFSSFVN